MKMSAPSASVPFATRLASAALLGFAGITLVIAGCKAPATKPRIEPTTSPIAASAVSTGVAGTAYDVPRLRADLEYLAADDREGRGIGTRGLDESADYIAKRFHDLRLRPVSGNGYFQPLTMNMSTSIGEKTRLAFGAKTYSAGTDYSPIGFSSEGAFSAPLVFAGYGASNDKQNYDDYAGIDVKGKAVLVFRFEPHNEKGTSRFADNDWSIAASLNEKAKLAADHGAVAIIMVNPPKFHGSDRLVPLSRGGGKSSIPFVQVKREVATDMLKSAGADVTDLEKLQDTLDTTGKPHSFALTGSSIQGNVSLVRGKAAVKNVLAVLPGRTHPDEYVVVGAHYDHLGRGGPGARDTSSDIHNGADDNASGTSAVLDLAERLVRAGRRDRSILFICFTGEEEGLIGSQYFANNPLVPLDKIVAMLNLDMVGRLRNELLYTGGEGTAGAFEPILNKLDDASPLTLKSIGKGGYGPSDHQSFAMKKIPVLYFFTGMHADYHTPTDDADKVNYEGISEICDVSQKLISELATMPRQQYVDKYDSQGLAINMGSPGSIGGSGGGGRRATLGVVPDYGTDETADGVRISGTTPGSPAAAAGLRDGDVIVQIADKKIGNLYDLSAFLAQAKPGDDVTVVIKRDAQRVELHAKLAERKES